MHRPCYPFKMHILLTRTRFRINCNHFVLASLLCCTRRHDAPTASKEDVAKKTRHPHSPTPLRQQQREPERRKEIF